MGKKNKKVGKKKVIKKPDIQTQKFKAERIITFFNNLPNLVKFWIKFAAAFLIFWFCIMVIFHDFTAEWITHEQNHFHLSGDNLSAAATVRMGESFQEEGKVPNWCPYIMCGIPMVGSLLYANHYYWAFYSTTRQFLNIRQFLSYLFLGSNFGWLFIHYIIAGLGIYILLVHFRVKWIIAVLFGILFAFNPTMVVFADVGHGLKVMTIAYLPWLLYFTIRLFNRQNILWIALLAFFFGWQLLAQHVQIVYYGVMMMGLYAVYSVIAGKKKELRNNIKATSLLILSGLIGLSFASQLYLQILEYIPFSIRGGGATGGASWDYATAWSFHPLESLTYIFPSFFGFGRETYWGFMPFTDMPLYWGGLVLLFVPWAIVLKRDRMTIFLIVLAIAAWIVSFGKFLPVLFWPLYELLPYFNKFRVPSLIQVLVLLPVILLAGRGLQAIWEHMIAGGEKTAALGRKVFLVGTITAGVCVLLLILNTALRPLFLDWISSARPQMQSQNIQAAYGLFVGDLWRLLLLVCVLYGPVILVLLKKWPRWVLLAAAAVVVILELNHFDKKLIRPPTPLAYVEEHLKADDVVKFLRNDQEPFRIFPISGGRHPNWYTLHCLESTLGYTAAKMRLYQEAVDSLSYNNQNLWKLMNVRYFISDRPIVHDDFEEVFVGHKERVYRYKRGFPRAFLVNRAVQVASASEVFSLYRSGSFDFSRIAVLEDPLSGRLDEEAEGNVSWVKKSPDGLVLDVESSGRQVLVLSEMYYPSGWTATVDGSEVPILKCNYLFRGLEVPAGSHRVELTFKPESAGKGTLLNRSAWAIIIVLFGIAALQWRSKNRWHSRRGAVSPSQGETGGI